MANPSLTPSDHQVRALKHEDVAHKLFAQNEEWSAVCFFYASLHRVQAALAVDPLFGDAPRLRAKHAMLRPEDRHTSSHNGFFSSGQKRWGLNELITLLYRQVSRPYEALYINSIHVRYGTGAELSLGRLREHAVDIKIAFQQGKLTA